MTNNKNKNKKSRKYCRRQRGGRVDASSLLRQFALAYAISRNPLSGDPFSLTIKDD